MFKKVYPLISQKRLSPALPDRRGEDWKKAYFMFLVTKKIRTVIITITAAIGAITIIY